MRKFNHKNTSSNIWGRVFRIAVLAAMILALACFVSCKNDDDDETGMETTVELTGTTNPTFEDGSKTAKDEDASWWELTISGTTATMTWLKSNSYRSGSVYIYDGGIRVGEIHYTRDESSFTATWEPKSSN